MRQEKQNMGNTIDKMKSDFAAQNAICYSGYRYGQHPEDGIFPSYDQVRQDLLILNQHWSLLRLYDCSHHAQLVLNVIRNEKLGLRVLLGADLGAEVSNPNCPWGAHYEAHQLDANRLRNKQQIRQMIDTAKAFPELVFAVSIGNEASVDWTDHLVPVESLIDYARQVKSAIPHPVTFCENYVPWTDKLLPLVAHLDFISVHTYPAWEYKSIDEAISYTEQNYQQVVSCHPDKPVIITEAGWTTRSNGRGIETHNANEHHQQTYCRDLMDWSRQNNVLTFLFEAFDEPWKGSPELDEPEKHWGLFYEDRTPKPVMQTLFEERSVQRVLAN